MTPSAPTFPTTATHWGTYRGEVRGGRLVALHPFEGDPDPSPIARNVPAGPHHPAPRRPPAPRPPFLGRGGAAGGEGRGAEPFVEVGWDARGPLTNVDDTDPPSRKGEGRQPRAA